MGVFMCRQFFIIVLFAVGVYVVLDVNKYNSLKESNTGKFLRDRGLLKYVERTFIRFRTFCRSLYWSSKQHVPAYLSKAREGIVPCFLVVKDILTSLALHLWTSVKLLYQYIVEKRLLFFKWTNHYAPGLTERVHQWLTDAWRLLVEYTRLLINLLLKYLSLSLQWLEKNVFVGKLSPENLQKYAIDAFGVTWSYTKAAVTWIQDKVAAASATM